MKYLSSDEEKIAFHYIEKAAKVAHEATCQRSKCGSVIVNYGEIIGVGFNSPPGNAQSQRRCLAEKDLYNKKITDKTCCIHAEQRAIMDALQKNPEKIVGSRLYFIRLDENDEPLRAGEPYCTICSKMALDVSIAEFVLWRERGLAIYETGEYNTLSYQFHA
jgi:deoxycytidylate deaminase